MRLKSETDYSAWLLYIIISIFILTIDSLGWLSGIRSVGEKVLNPTSAVVRKSTQKILMPIQMIRFASSGPERILNLESRYAQAIVSLEQLESIKKENTSLKKLLGSNPHKGFIYHPATVVGGIKEIILSSGTASGIEAGDTVVDSANVLVGRVNRISAYTSWVTTPEHHLNKIPVIIGSKNIPGSMTNGQSGDMQIDVLQSEVVNLGDYVFTSGVNGDYVPKVLIGHISFVEVESSSIHKNVKVDLLSNPSDTVFIISEGI